MTLGLSLSAFTLLHVIISLVAISAGAFVVLGLIAGRRLNGWTGLFLASSVLTDVTGYMFPFEKLLPSHILGAISLLVLAIAIFAIYGRHLATRWRRTYAITAVIGLYLNMFVLIVQAFEKVPSLKSLAPTQTETPFKVAQLALLLIFLVVGIMAARRFKLQSSAAAAD